MTKTNTKLGKNAASFEKHLNYGLQVAELDIADYHPMLVRDTEDKSKIGFAIIQQPDDPDSICICFEDALHFDPSFNKVSMPITKDQPASLLATLVLSALLTNDVVAPPKCPHCEKEEAA
tara:strand:- start:301 stop:660 length:360 start_codon:yes stop_codon:yes gene_type:complete